MKDTITFDTPVVDQINQLFNISLESGFDAEYEIEIHGDGSRFHVWDNLEVTGTVCNGVYLFGCNNKPIGYLQITNQRLIGVAVEVDKFKPLTLNIIGN